MQLNRNFHEVFGQKPVLGMIHLAREPGEDPVERALKEMELYEQEGLTGVIIENYHGSPDDVVETLDAASELDTSLVVGVNILPNEFHNSIPLAAEYGARFVQLDYVAGIYISASYPHEVKLPYKEYKSVREEYPDILVLGGVFPKHYQPLRAGMLDLRQGMRRAEAIVVTGRGTGEETPMEKIKRFRKFLGDHPLIVGAGTTPENVYEQLKLADGAIVGTSMKVDDDTHSPLDREKIKGYMKAVELARETD